MSHNRRLQNQRLTVFTRQYLEAALWASRDDDDEPLDSTYGIEDFAPRALEIARRDCDAFQHIVEGAGLRLSGDDEADGHDFWLTRNRHGAGFWDRSYYGKHTRQQLTTIAHGFGEQDIVVGDDGLLHLEGGREVRVNPHNIPAATKAIPSARYELAVSRETWNEQALSAGETDDKDFYVIPEPAKLREAIEFFKKGGPWDHLQVNLRGHTHRASIIAYPTDGDRNFRTGEVTYETRIVSAAPRDIRRLIAYLPAAYRTRI